MGFSRLPIPNARTPRAGTRRKITLDANRARVADALLMLCQAALEGDPVAEEVIATVGPVLIGTLKLLADGAVTQ